MATFSWYEEKWAFMLEEKWLLSLYDASYLQSFKGVGGTERALHSASDNGFH